MNDPTKRNRNIGTAKQGRGKNNKFRIPDSWWDGKVFYERLNKPVMVKRSIFSKEYTFIVEPTLSDFIHPCTVDDVCKIIELLPVQDLFDISIVVLRQPKRKEVILRSVWGRLVFYYEATRNKGPAIMLEAQGIRKPIRWDKSIRPEDDKELSRLEADGHEIEYGPKGIEVITTVDSCRSTQLYRTIPHEVGHYVDYHRTKNKERYFSKPYQEREAFAHRYADEFRSEMTGKGRIPFERIINKHSFVRDSLAMDWFLASLL